MTENLAIQEAQVDARDKKRGGASGRVYDQLKHDILSGEIEAGTLLSESEIAGRFGVSRTPVREALKRLACDRVVIALPQRGHLVRTVSVSEIVEAFRVRELLEVEAAGEAARRITDEEVSYLKSLLEPDVEEPALVNYRIHSAIATIAGNRLLADFIQETLVLMQRMIATHPDRLVLEPERQVVGALEARDVEGARQAMRAHIRDVMDKLL